MINIIVLISVFLITGIVGFLFGRRYQFARDQKAIDDHTKYLKDTIYNLIVFGVQQGFPFEKIGELEQKEEKLTQRESLYVDLKEALDKEEYEKSLAELDPVTKQRLLLGDWSIRPSGNMFKRQWLNIIEDYPKQDIKIVRFWDKADTGDLLG